MQNKYKLEELYILRIARGNLIKTNLNERELEKFYLNFNLRIKQLEKELRTPFKYKI